MLLGDQYVGGLRILMSSFILIFNAEEIVFSKLLVIRLTTLSLLVSQALNPDERHAHVTFTLFQNSLKTLE